jgi:putative endonuclease
VAFFTYILASQRNGTIYTGMTDDIAKRVWQHRTGQLKSFT